MSPKIICLKHRTNFPDPPEFWPQRLFAFELRGRGDAARAYWRGSQQGSARALGERGASPNYKNFCRSRDDPAAHLSNSIAHFALDFSRQESVCVVVTASEPEAFAPLPRQRPSASAGFRWWRRDLALTRLRGVLACPSASVREWQRRSLPPKSARRQLAAGFPAIAKRERIRNRRGCLHC